MSDLNTGCLIASAAKLPANKSGSCKGVARSQTICQAGVPCTKASSAKDTSASGGPNDKTGKSGTSCTGPQSSICTKKEICKSTGYTVCGLPKKKKDGDSSHKKKRTCAARGEGAFGGQGGLLGWLLGFLTGPYGLKILKALAFFLLGLKIARECNYMLVPIKDYMPYSPSTPFYCAC